MARFKEVYKTKAWKKIRPRIIERDNGLYQECMRKGIIRPGKEVHHIIELMDENKND